MSRRLTSHFSGGREGGRGEPANIARVRSIQVRSSIVRETRPLWPPRRIYFMLGGHSFVAAQLIARIRATFSVELGLRTIFKHPIATAIAQQIDQQILAKL